MMSLRLLTSRLTQLTMLVIFLIFWSASLSGVFGEEPAAHHEFMAQPFGQSISEEVKLVSFSSCHMTRRFNEDGCHLLF